MCIDLVLSEAVGRSCMKITILYDNTVFQGGLSADWGFSALVEANGKRILFDTGGNGSILLSNMKKLGVDPQSIHDVFISHAHFDHTGGLSAFLNENAEVTVWAPPSFKWVLHARKVVTVKTPVMLYEGIYSTGELEGIEQSLCFQTRKGVVIVAGCSHPDLRHIIDAASKHGRVYGIIGGLHRNTPDTLENLEFICETHCTQYKREIQDRFPESYIEGGAGRILEMDE